MKPHVYFEVSQPQDPMGRPSEGLRVPKVRSTQKALLFPYNIWRLLDALTAVITSGNLSCHCYWSYSGRDIAGVGREKDIK